MKRLADQTLYEILEVREDAAAADIRSACERASALYGPGSLATYSLMSPDEAELLTRRIEEARTTLLDPDLRARYDEELQRRPAEARAATGSNGAAPTREPPPVIPAVRCPRSARARRTRTPSSRRRRPRPSRSPPSRRRRCPRRRPLPRPSPSR